MRENLIVRILGSILAGVFLCFLIPSAYAADFKTSYNIEYFIKDNDPQNLTKASYSIKLTNLKPDLILKKFTLILPKSFGIGNMIAKDFRGTILPVIVEKERTVEVSFELNDAKAGLNEVTILYLDFLQKNIFRSKGSIWEVFIPTIENKEGDTYSVTVNLPPGRNKKLSLAKPLPDLVTFDKAVWNNYTGKSIYAAFGDQQRYTLDLTYHITNPNIYKVYTDVAFPPDTLYQKIIVNSIIPPPDLVFTDSDGNYMGRYYLNGKEDKQILFTGIASIYTQPRNEYRAYIKKQFSELQKSLFDQQNYWKLNGETPITSSNIKDHFDYAIRTLTYNFNRVIKGNSRMGAIEALKYPDQAVCTEFSDVLISSARQRGIYVREAQGFAFANEQELRPISQESDILHSWVEYYDVSKNIWVPIDPTWQNTSGLDYFDSFDFNHIVFALHGKKADYPFPAGSYKSGPGGKDIRIEPTSSNLAENKKISATLTSMPLPSENELFSLDLEIKNEGNVNVWEVPVSVTADNATIDTTLLVIPHLLPGEKQKISLHFKPKSALFYQDVQFTVSSENKQLLVKTIQVPTFITTFKGYLVPAVCITAGLIILFLLFRKRSDEE